MKEEILNSLNNKKSFYGIIGNGETCALIDPNGSIDWFCYPRFDSPFLFGKIIDDSSGYWNIYSENIKIDKISQQYIKNTGILETTYYNNSNEPIFSINDFMSWRKNQLNRIINVFVQNSIICSEIFPTFNYNLENYELSIKDYENSKVLIINSKDSDNSVIIFIKAQPASSSSQNFEIITANITSEDKFKIIIKFKSLKDIKSIEMALNYFENKNININNFLSKSSLKDELQNEIKFWKDWISKSNYRGIYEDEFNRSLITMKLLTYEPTGAIIAAATTSIPQHPGSGSNWDYRFCWIRDGSYAASAYALAGYFEEAEKFLDFCFSIMSENTKPFQPLYRIDGNTDCSEKILSHLKGFLGDGPVRIGNLAFEQVQNDLEGEFIDALWIFYENSKNKSILEKYWNKILKIVDWIENHWMDEDNGIWELRGVIGHYTHSKIMCWTSLNRIIKISKILEKIEYVDKWNKILEEIKKDILINGYNKKMKTFTLGYGVPINDTSTLVAILSGLIEPEHEYAINMIKRTEKELCFDNLVARNIFEPSPFHLTTFWMSRCYILMKQKDKALQIIKKSIEQATDLGLFCEQSLSAEELPKLSKKIILRAVFDLIFSHRNFREFKDFIKKMKNFYKYRNKFKEKTKKPKLNKEQSKLFKGNFPQLYSHEELVQTLIYLEKN